MIGLRMLRMLQEDEDGFAGSSWVWASLSWCCLPTLFQTSVPHSVLNEPGIADKNFSISASSVRLSISHRIARTSRPLHATVSSIASCICPCAMFVLTDFIPPLDPRSLNFRPYDFWNKYQKIPENEFR